MTIYVGPRISSATGGTITNIAGFTVHTFTSSGTFVPNGSGFAEVLVVGAGGGMTGSIWSSGGGGGSVVYQKFVPVLSGVPYTMNVGTGGVSVSRIASTCTYNGGSITAPGGGGNGENNPLGSGGGGAVNSPATIGAGVIGLGFSGGRGCPSGSSGLIGSGGGGAGSFGRDGQVIGIPTTPITGQGGIGVSYSITGVSRYYGGGGSGVLTGLNPSSSPTDFGLGGSGPGPSTPSNPGVIIIRYIS